MGHVTWDTELGTCERCGGPHPADHPDRICYGCSEEDKTEDTSKFLAWLKSLG